MNKWACLMSVLLLCGCGGGGGSAGGGGDPGGSSSGGSSSGGSSSSSSSGGNNAPFLSWQLEVDSDGQLRDFSLDETHVKLWLEEAGEVTYPGHFYGKKPMVDDVEYMLLKLLNSGTADGKDHWYVAALDRKTAARSLMPMPVDGLAAAHGMAGVELINSASGLFDVVLDPDGRLRLFMVTESRHHQNGEAYLRHVLSRYWVTDGELVLEAHEVLAPALALSGQKLALSTLEVLDDYILLDSYTGENPNITNIRFHLLHRADLTVARDSFALVPRAYGHQVIEKDNWLHLLERENENIYNERDGLIERYSLYESPEYPNAESQRSRVRSFRLSDLLNGVDLPAREHLLPACAECLDNNGTWYDQRVATNAIIAGDGGRLFMAYSRKPGADQPGAAIAIEVLDDQVTAASDFATSLRGEGDAVKTADVLSHYYRHALSFMKPAPDGGFYLMAQTLVDTENHNSLDSQYLTLMKFDRDGRPGWMRKIDAKGNPGRFANATVSALQVDDDGVSMVVTGAFDAVDDTAGPETNVPSAYVHFTGGISAAAAEAYQQRPQDLTAFTATGPSLAEALPGNSYYFSLDSGSAFWIRFEEDTAYTRSWYGGFDESYVVFKWQEGEGGIHRQHQTILVCHPGETQWRAVELPEDNFSPLTGSRGGILMDGKDMSRTSREYTAVAEGETCEGYGA
ncbi:hypothetical protein [Microbulbifer sp. SH-1]|uniref:hypothetical protein n=1 Tax=Microbulbifer sp. SH-1 TaxID=2681547 RepID=UPI00197BC87B|nr:hypothetical protein [Microbulbifer sp. SH-1]